MWTEQNESWSDPSNWWSVIDLENDEIILDVLYSMEGYN